MSGKAYTMKEMKDIVTYLTEHKAYSDIKGRKMWMDLASSDATTRTWQSLKETFLKRILPDIHNPYYNLSVHQLASFKQGCDIEAKLNNKLEIISSDAVVNTEDDISVTDQVETGKENDKDMPTGEDLQQPDTKARDSTDTLILENCYQSSEDIKKDLQSANEDDGKEDAQPKSLRDLITYSEPLNMLQNTIDDFATDEEGSNGEPQMQIVEPEEITKKDTGSGDNCIIEIDSDSGEKEKTNQSPAKQVTDIALPEEKSEKSGDADKVVAESDKNNESINLFPENHVDNKTNEAEDINNANKSDNQRKSSEITQNTNTITDSLPSNQEAFQNKTKKASKEGKQDEKKSRKRANSQESSKSKDSKRKNLSLKKQSISDSDTTKLRKDKKILNPKTIEENLNKADEINEPVNNETLNNSKTGEDATDKTSDLEHQDVEMITSDVENPCLKSVSLYEEELTYNKSLESDKEKNKNTKEQLKNKTNEVVILKSHSDSVSDSLKAQAPAKKRKQEVIKQTRDRAIADVFGLSRGGVSKKRKRTVSYKHSSHQTHHISSGSSEWTSDSDSEFISPPRGRKNRQTRKYLKPRPARILSLEEEGGLFVMYGKKIYPIVKDGKIIKNYVTYTPEEEVDQEESFWKLKYVEEKKRTDKLTKLLNEVADKTDSDVNQTSALALPENVISNIKHKEVTRHVPDKPSAAQSKTESEDKTIKLKFTKNNEELQLEGHWSHVNPVLAQVMQLLQKGEKNDNKQAIEDQNKKKNKTSDGKSANQNKLNVNGTKSNLEEPAPQESGQTTPIIPLDVEDEVKERVNQIESEIFKEIEENNKEESNETTNRKTSPEEYVTKRRGRPRKSSVASASVSESPLKKPKLDAEPNKDKEITETDKNSSKTLKTRSPKKSLSDSPKEAKTRESLSRKSKEIASSNINKTEAKGARYKFPSPQTATSKTAKASKSKANRYLTLEPKEHSSPESRSFCSIDSTQGYQESDESVLGMSLRKRKTSKLPHKRKCLSRYRTNSHPFLTDDITSESSNSYQSSPLRSMTFQNSTISSNNYSSESYRLLMNKNFSQKKNMFQNLERIDESPNLNELKCTKEQFYEDETNDVEMPTDRRIKDGTFKITHTDEDSASNVSLPTSPVLSIVENMSVSKDLLSIVDDFPAEKLHCSNKIILNDFIKSDADVSMPLMARDCAFETNGHNEREYHYNISTAKDVPTSETFLNKVSIKDPTLTDSINTKLKDLVLESTKKTLKGICGSDRNNNIENKKEEYAQNMKTKSRKRSSTPRKSKSSRRLNLANNEPCIEEHTESCSYSRKSCPPAVQHFEVIDINSNLKQNIENKPKTRQKKDVIKVKITKPKQKSVKETVTENISEKSISNEVDSSVNESGVFLHCFNDSVDLVHNHSETCLNAHDCMGDSVEILENSKSVIFLDSTTNSDQLQHKHEDSVNNLECELFSDDAQDGAELGKGKSTSPTVYHSVCVSEQNSLITEDLSVESPVKNIQDGGNKIARSTKWYLLSEDETTNTNFLDINQNLANGLGYGSNLNQLFPVTCAVPDLSTITEASSQNEDNLKKLDN